jgi:Cys-tRNA(Pro)/Cys-tRNA(Cys) deacylase
MPPKLNSMRLLEQHNIPYEVVEYPDDMRDAEEIAEIIGAPPHLVYKTLVVEPEGGGKPMLVMIAANRRLNLKKLAQAAGYKKVRMAAHKDAEALTGLKVGGISALALTQKNWLVFLDQPAAAHEHILISGGQRGIDLRVPTRALIAIVRARVADVGRDADGEVDGD